MKTLVFAALALLVLAGQGRAAGAPAIAADVAAAAPTVDFGRSFTLNLEVDVGDEPADLQPLYDALDSKGFRSSISVRQSGDAKSASLIAERLTAWRYADCSRMEFDALSGEIDALVRPFGGRVRWTFRQDGILAPM